MSKRTPLAPRKGKKPNGHGGKGHDAASLDACVHVDASSVQRGDEPNVDAVSVQRAGDSAVSVHLGSQDAGTARVEAPTPGTTSAGGFGIEHALPIPTNPAARPTPALPRTAAANIPGAPTAPSGGASQRAAEKNSENSAASSRQVVAFSGGKDSTATALLLHERGEDFDLLFTPTGNELPALAAHMDRVVALVGRRLLVPANRSLGDWIAHYGALPNNRQRWCTRLIKIEPCVAWLKRHPGTTLCIGLRADEEARQGLYGDYATYRYPLREAGLGLEAVVALCERHGVLPQFRTDCAVCPYQRLIEWHALWRDHPEEWARGEAWEAETGHTFRSPSRDSWPAGMAAMRVRFDRGDIPVRSVPREQACRVCAL